MHPFTRNEAIGVFLIFFLTFIFTLKGLSVAERRERDARRRDDLGLISDALYKFHQDFGFFPPDEAGKIKMCRGSEFEKFLLDFSLTQKLEREAFLNALVGCKWGEDSLANPIEGNVYLSNLPKDPSEDKGVSYLYLSNTRRFQIYAYLEGEEAETGYNKAVVERNLACGSKVCSFGKSSGDTPIEISIKDYEERLKSQ